MSLDGFFEGPNKEFNFFVPDAEFLEYAKDMLRSVDTILFGKTTYLYMAGYWPSADKDEIANKDEIADKMNGLAKIVFSTTLDKAEWNNSRLVKSDIVAEVSRLKQEPGKDMVILGSAMLASHLLQEGLIDEYRVILVPVLLGKGHLLFNGINRKLDLKLNQTKPLASGAAVLYYQKA